MWFDAFTGSATSYTELSKSWTPEQKAFSDRVFARAIAEIQQDLVEGNIPLGLACFDALKRANKDAGAYGGLWEQDIEDEGARLFSMPDKDGHDCISLLGYTWACATIRQRMHEWIKGRAADR